MDRYFHGKVGLWASHPIIISFSKPMNDKYDNQLLIWKVLSFLPTPSLPNSIPTSISPSLVWKLSLIFIHSRKLKYLILVQKPKFKTPRRCQNILSARLEDMGVQENSEKTKWSSGGESGYPKTETLTFKCVIDSQICVQDNSINKKNNIKHLSYTIKSAKPLKNQRNWCKKWSIGIGSRRTGWPVTIP